MSEIALNRIKSKVIKDTFNVLNREGIRYFVLRGFIPIEELDQSKDIDLYINSDDLLKTEKLLKGLGWQKDKYKVGRYPHVFFRYNDGSNNNSYVLDTVTGLYYGKRLLGFKLINKITDEINNNLGIKTADSATCILLFLLHIVFDKGRLSPQNKVRLYNMWNYYIEQSSNSQFQLFLNPFLNDRIKWLLGADDDCKAQIIQLKDELIKLDLLDFSLSRYLLKNTVRAMNLVLYKITNCNFAD